MKFSERVAGRPAPKSGLEEASNELRTALWNLLHEHALPDEATAVDSHQKAVVLWGRLGWRTDHAPWGLTESRNRLAEYWFRWDWAEFFDAVEVVVDLIQPRDRERQPRFLEALNAVLQGQGCAYRFISGQLAPLTNPSEVQEVARAAESAIPAVATHIREALTLLPPHANANPRNSVKESISAVEAAVKRLSGDQSATLTSGLSAFEKKYGDLHPALRAGLVKLYGYTSDEKGIRHALIEESAEVTVDDARFMVVICSAFANYLVALSSGSSANAST